MKKGTDWKGLIFYILFVLFAIIFSTDPFDLFTPKSQIIAAIVYFIGLVFGYGLRNKKN